MSISGWDTFKALNAEFKRLKIDENINFDKFYLYSIIAHSTQLEGSTLTDMETQLLFDQKVTADKKPLIYHQMNQDLKKAYDLAIEMADNKERISPEMLKKLSAAVMDQTGSSHNSAMGFWDETKGDFRKHGVRAGVDGKSYVNFQKVPMLVDDFCIEINKRLKEVNKDEDIYKLSFDAHFNLVTIHPWGDGNGRMARLIMNYIQFYHNVFPTRMYLDDKANYITQLENSREIQSLEPIRNFLLGQHNKTLTEEIKNYHSKDNDFNLMFNN